jgi:hypothetical protein
MKNANLIFWAFSLSTQGMNVLKLLYMSLIAYINKPSSLKIVSWMDTCGDSLLIKISIDQ